MFVMFNFRLFHTFWNVLLAKMTQYTAIETRIKREHASYQPHTFSISPSIAQPMVRLDGIVISGVDAGLNYEGHGVVQEYELITKGGTQGYGTMQQSAQSLPLPLDLPLSIQCTTKLGACHFTCFQHIPLNVRIHFINTGYIHFFYANIWLYNGSYTNRW